MYYFLPAALLLYAIAPGRLKNTVLLLVSLLFYSFGEPRFLGILVLSIVFSYVFGLLISYFRAQQTPAGIRLSRFWLILALCVLLGVLGCFKYADFFIENYNTLTGASLPLLSLTLPIGISFYTFQLLSYLIDVYRGTVSVQKNPLLLATYTVSFPQLIAGPIVRYADVAAQLTDRTHSYAKAACGIRRFILGLAKKVLIANSLGELCELFRASQDPSVLFFWLYAIAFTLHIYYDFSGYSDMAIGLGKIMGFDFPENFNYPYLSASITEFWRRWHISLGSWFRDYLYIPLGGSRVSQVRWLFNIFIVWFATGFWHGASFTFILWGLLYGLLLVLEKLFLKKLLSRTRLLKHLYVMLFVTLGFVLFNATDVGEAVLYLKAMFGLSGYPLVSVEFLYYLKSYARLLLIAILGTGPVLPALGRFFAVLGRFLAAPERLFAAPGRFPAAPGRFFADRRVQKIPTLLSDLLEPLLLIGLMLLITASLVDGSYNPFLYFRF